MKTSAKLMAFIYTCIAIVAVLAFINMAFKIIAIATWISILMIVPWFIYTLVKRKK